MNTELLTSKPNSDLDFDKGHEWIRPSWSRNPGHLPKLQHRSHSYCDHLLRPGTLGP